LSSRRVPLKPGGPARTRSSAAAELCYVITSSNKRSLQATFLSAFAWTWVCKLFGPGANVMITISALFFKTNVINHFLHTQFGSVSSQKRQFFLHV
jgi:hypothetical protein